MQEILACKGKGTAEMMRTVSPANSTLLRMATVQQLHLSNNVRGSYARPPELQKLTVYEMCSGNNVYCFTHSARYFLDLGFIHSSLGGLAITFLHLHPCVIKVYTFKRDVVQLRFLAWRVALEMIRWREASVKT